MQQPFGVKADGARSRGRWRPALDKPVKREPPHETRPVPRAVAVLADSGAKVGKLPASIELRDLLDLGHPPSPIRSIRAKCLDCSVGGRGRLNRAGDCRGRAGRSSRRRAA